MRILGRILVRILAVHLGFLAVLNPASVAAQQQSWLQIEAQPALNAALDRARAYAALFPDVEGYRLEMAGMALPLGRRARRPQGRACWTCGGRT